MNYGKIGKMKYIEELAVGDVFVFQSKLFILTSDFKKNGSRLATCLSDGFPSWFKSDEIVHINQIFTLDTDNNIIPIQNVNHSSQNQNIPQVASVAHNGGIA